MMFSKDQKPMGSSGHAQTIIAQGVRVEGDFTSQGDVLIEGEVEGSVSTASALRIGETSRIRADVSAQSAVVAGIVEGNIRVAETLELLESSRVEGDIEAKVLSVASGAKVNGRISMDEHAGKKEGKKREALEDAV